MSVYVNVLLHNKTDNSRLTNHTLAKRIISKWQLSITTAVQADKWYHIAGQQSVHDQLDRFIQRVIVDLSKQFKLFQQ